jgi:hypothetical protein
MRAKRKRERRRTIRVLKPFSDERQATLELAAPERIT